MSRLVQSVGTRLGDTSDWLSPDIRDAEAFVPAGCLLLRSLPQGESRLPLLIPGGRTAEVAVASPGASVFALYDPADGPWGEPVAMAVTVPVGNGATVELSALIVAPTGEGSGLGARLVVQLADALRTKGVRRLAIPLAEAEAALVIPLQRLGFKLVPTETDPPAPLTQTSNGDRPGGDWIWLVQDL